MAPVMSEQVYSFEAIIYSRDKLHRNRLNSEFTLENNESAIYVKNIEKDKSKGKDKDKIIGELRFKVDSTASVNEIEDLAKQFFTRFENSILVAGFVLKDLKYEWVKSSHPQTRTVSITYNFSYTVEGKSGEISDSDIQHIKKFFGDMELEPRLLEMVNAIKKCKGTPEDNFTKYWRLIDGRYGTNGGDLIKNYMKERDDDENEALCIRNNILFYLLSKANIKNRKGKNKSEDLLKLQNANEKKDTDVVEAAIRCVKELRNGLFHGEKFCFADEKRLVNFVFDLVYVDQIANYGKDVVPSFYYIENGFKLLKPII